MLHSLHQEHLGNLGHSLHFETVALDRQVCSKMLDVFLV